MIEFEEHIEYFVDHWLADFSKLVPESEWGDKKAATTYLEKYWLPESEYEDLWKPLYDTMFVNQDEGLPELIFSEGYNILALRGGCLFLEEDFKPLQKCLIEIGETHLFVVQNTFGGKVEEPTFRMKFPIEISWEELISGNYISAMFLESFHSEFFVFGTSELWGKYSANDYESPLDIVGFKPEVADT